jgi:hypothetical protein
MDGWMDGWTKWMAGMVKNAPPHDWTRKIENQYHKPINNTFGACLSANRAPGGPFRPATTARDMWPMVSLGYSASEKFARIGLDEL